MILGGKIIEVVHEADRSLLYIFRHAGIFQSFYVIAPPGSKYRAGDEIRYEVAGVNFGWLVE